MKRTFTVSESCIHVAGGRYKSDNPVSAAKKAASRLFKIAKANSIYKSIRRITFTLRETGSKQLYKYKAARIKLAKPTIRIINGKTIENKYKIEITSDNNNEIKCKKI
jgi:hypothetical protein